MRARDIMALIILVVVAFGGQLMRGEDATPRAPAPDSPRRPAPEHPGSGAWDAETRDWVQGAPSRNPNRSSPFASIPRESVVDIPRQRSSGVGTAFAVGPGAWITARHVIDGCDDIGVQFEPRKAIKVANVRLHKNADVALLQTRRASDPFEIAKAAAAGEDGYMVGFPGGSPGAVHARMIGETVLREQGRYRTRERADVWAERSRIPDRFGSLGRLSGGPVFDGQGRILGAVLAEEPRRGRIIAAKTSTLRDLVTDKVSGTPGVSFTGNSYPQTARTLITGLRVARVLCRVR